MMTTTSTVVGSLLNQARPGLVPGCEWRPVGGGEVAVRHLAKRRTLVLPEKSAPVLELLDGKSTLNEIAAGIMARTGRVRHQHILETVVRLRSAGLLAPLEAPLEEYLALQGEALLAPKLSRVLKRLATLRLMLPLRLGTGSQGEGRTLSGHGAFLFAIVVAMCYVLATIPTLLGMTAGPGEAGLFGSRPLTGMLLALGGVILAASLRELVRGALLLRQGRTVLGIGLKVTLGLPYVGFDARDEVMLTRDERLVYRVVLLAVPVALVVALAVLQLVAPGETVQALTLGAHAAVLAALSPLWAGDLTAFLEELLEARSLRRLSGRYLARKLWRSVVHQGPLGREEGALMAFASLRLLYLFVLVLLLAWLLPFALEALTTALLSPDTPVGQLIVALIVTGYLACAFLLLGLLVLGLLAQLLAQLVPRRHAAGAPTRVTEGSALPLAELVAELRAIPPFSGLPEELVAQTLEGGRLEHYPAGTRLIRQGEPGDTAYVLRAGRAQVLVEDAAGTVRQVAVLGPGHFFGEVALLTEAPRAASVVAVEEIEVVALNGPAFLTLVAQGGFDRKLVLERVRIHLFLSSVELLRSVSASGMARIMAAIRIRRAEAGEIVVRQGEEGYSMFLIFRGRCAVLVDDEQIATLGEGQYFGEIALVTGAVRSATIRCATEAVLVELPAAVYQDVIVQEFNTGLVLDREVESRLSDLATR